MRTPSNDSLLTAAEWLRANEAGDAEQAACEAVAVYLENLVAEKMIRHAARLAGVTTAAVRRKLAENRQ